jgi:pimeloyl-ACP methyl ester carboxylesterase
VHPEVVIVLREDGIELGGARPQKLTPELASQAQLLITMGCGDACPYVPGVRRDDWPLEDPKGQPLDRVRAIRDDMQRMSRHEHPDAVAEALRWIPRSAAFDGMAALEELRVPTLVVGSRDDTDPDHPLAVAEEYARLIPGARLVVEEPGQSPLAWRGGSLSKEILASLAQVP